MTTPQVPPRPARSQANEPTVAATTGQTPTIPPRPTDKRSESPRSANYVRSPLNDPPFHPTGTDGASDLHRMASLNASRGSVDLPPRPPSVNLPTIGQEGSEYEASTPQPEDTLLAARGESPAASPTHTREVSHDLPLHAPRPSLSSSDAKQRVAAVVRTDSNQAVVSVGSKAAPAAADSPLRSKPSFNRPPSSSSYDRPGSAYEDEHGIPSFGQQVPLGHQYGDVQAPSPAPGSQPQTPSTPNFERPSSGKHHHRTKSGRNSFQAPPGSYGLHGHGQYEKVDEFEKAWLQKHPEVLREEIAAHSPAILDRHDYTLTPDELNKLVKKSKIEGLGVKQQVGMPDEQIGYLASEAYASRNTTPKPPGAFDQHKPASIHSPYVDSPLRNPSTSADDLTKISDVIHVDEPEHKENKYMGRGQVAEQEHVDLGPSGGSSETEEGWIDEHGYRVPILASDEIDPTNAHLHPAVPPISEGHEHSNSRPNSRPSSRPGSVHNIPVLTKSTSRGEWDVHHLEDVREYEPLFPEDEMGAKKAGSAAERFKQRPDMKQRFPSKDIWEDAPASVNLEATVETPEPEHQSSSKSAFETPAQEAARKGEISEAEKAKLLPKEARLAQSNFKPHIKQEMRPSVAQQRFPSRDIWEDSPDSAYITTTVGDGEVEDEGTKAGAVVQTSIQQPREDATAGAPAMPVVPPRPIRANSPAKENKTPPLVPARPARRPSPMSADASVSAQDPNVVKAKPAVPDRPSKPKAVEAAGSTESSERGLASEAAAKSKPQVPARPVGNKIAALQAGFMSDLNKKLGLGPQSQPPKHEEPLDEQRTEEEKKPLEDARKGRARGPARRKPAASPSAAAPATAKPASRKFVVSPVMNLFDISPEGTLNASHADVWSEKLASSARPEGAPITKEIPPAVGFNAQGEAVHPPTVTPEATKAVSHIESAPALQAEAEASGEPADVGHAAVPSSSAHVKVGADAAEDSPSGLTKTTSGTQTGEMNIVMDKDGPKQTELMGYKNGSVHEEGTTFVKKDEEEA